MTCHTRLTCSPSRADRIQVRGWERNLERACVSLPVPTWVLTRYDHTYRVHTILFGTERPMSRIPSIVLRHDRVITASKLAYSLTAWSAPDPHLSDTAADDSLPTYQDEYQDEYQGTEVRRLGIHVSPPQPPRVLLYSTSSRTMQPWELKHHKIEALIWRQSLAIKLSLLL